MGIEGNIFGSLKKAQDLAAVILTSREALREGGPHILDRDSEVVWVAIPRKGQRMAIEFNFHTLEGKDNFTSSQKTREDFYGNGGYTFFHSPYSEKDSSGVDIDDPSKEETTISAKAKELGLTPAEVFYAQQIALGHWIGAQERAAA